MTATAEPTLTAWRTLELEPTMYAAMSVLPCPGSRACQAPNAAARMNPSRISGVPWFARSPVKGPPSTRGRALLTAPFARSEVMGAGAGPLGPGA